MTRDLRERDQLRRRCSRRRPKAGARRPSPERLEDRLAPASLPGGFSEALVATGLTNPTAMEFAPDGRLFVAEQGGRLRVVKNGALLPTPFMSLSVNASGERGLLGVAFDPAFSSNNFVYVYYTTATSPIHNRVSRFTANGDVVVPGSEVVLLNLENLGATNHNGGAIHFGADGKLYVGVGENAVPSNSQSLNNRLGKILRINKDGSIPTDNPYFNLASGDNRAIWALGLRNPYTFAVQPGTGRIFINDVGQSTWEEINDGVAGANYGWPATEGFTSDPAYRSPLFAYGHGAGDTLGFAISGGAFYNPASAQFPGGYVGDYFFGDYVNDWIRRYDPGDGSVTGFATGLAGLVDLKVGSDGSLFALSRGTGTTTGTVTQVRYVASGRITGQVFYDQDGDGTRDPDEPGLQGVTVYLDQDQDGQLDSGEVSTTTDANSTYSFGGLAAGTYTVAQVPPFGWVQTSPGPGNGSYTVTLADGQVVTGKDFGNQRPEVQIRDDGTAGFATAGPWTVTTGGFAGDLRYSAAGTGADTATWTFSGLAAGAYRVSATWHAQPNRATNAPYTVLDGATPLATVARNQRLAPDDFVYAGVSWEDLGVFTIAGSTLVVRLSDAANGYVIADAIRIEPAPPPPAPEVWVLDGTTDVADGTGSVAFGSTTVGTPLTRTFTVHNVGTAPLTLGAITVPTGFTLAASFGATTLHPGTLTSFAVRFDAAAAGTFSGQVSFATNDGDENPFNFAVSATATTSGSVRILDDGSAGFATVGSWTVATGPGLYGPGLRYSAAGSGSDTATWTFSGLAAGRYRVSATWHAQTNRATDAPYAVLDGASTLATVRRNQELAPDDFADAGVSWEDLGTFTIAGSTLVVRLSDAANEYVIADAVRIAPATPNQAPTVGSLADTPDPIVQGGTLVLTAGAVSDADGAVASVSFYRETNGAAGLQAGPGGDMLVGTDTNAAGGWTAAVATAGLAPGTYTYYAQATDDRDARSVADTAAPSTTNIVQAPPAGTRILDDGSAGFATAGSWTVATGPGLYGPGLRYSAAGTGADTATWTFSGLAAGAYRVSATWHAQTNRATDAPYAVLDGASTLATVRRNQELAPDDFADAGVSWEDLGTFTIAGSTLVVRLSDAANEYVIADAIRIEPAATPSAYQVTQYNAIFGTSAASVPVENTGGAGTRDSHWRESVFGSELMTGFLNSGVANPLSRVTVASLGDLGYSVNLAAADAYVRPGSLAGLRSSTPAVSGRVLSMGLPITVLEGAEGRGIAGVGHRGPDERSLEQLAIGLLFPGQQDGMERRPHLASWP